MTEPVTTWLPNLVGGVSIWKLARDLNEPHLFDGRLLVPDAEGPDSLPTRVTWNLAGLLPLGEARASHPADVAAAVTDFLARLENVGRELEDPESGFHRFQEAFTVPGLEADGGAHYYFDPSAKKLCVINWGASPRAIAGAQTLVFGWQSFDKVGGAATRGSASAAVAAGASAVAAAAATAPATGGAPKDEKKDDKDGKDAKKAAAAGLLWGRPWWHWLIALLVAAAVVALVLFLLRACNAPPGSADAGGVPADSPPDTALDGVASTDGGTDARADGEAGAGADAGPADGSAEGAADGAGDAKTDAKADAGRDAKSDGAGGAGGDGAGDNGAGGGGGAGGTVVVGPGGNVIVGGSDPNALPHRFHFEPQAVRWRVSAGQNILDPSSPVEGSGQNFEVILKPGGSFDGVKVQWQDASGRWHQ